MGRITNVTVKYGRTTKPADYEAKRADVELTGIVDESEDEQAALDRLGVLAIGKCHELLGLAKPAGANVVKTGERTKADIAADAAKATGAEAPKPRGRGAATKPPPVPPAADPAAVEEAPKPAAPAPKSDDDELADLLGDGAAPAPKEITDQDIVTAITHKVDGLRKAGDTTAPQKLRELIGKHIAPPGQARQIGHGEGGKIDHTKRAKFLADLEALT